MTLQFPETFDETVCPGDSISLHIGSVEVVATAILDPWGEFIVSLSVTANGRLAEDGCGYVGGIDPESHGDHFTEIANDLLAQLDLTEVALRLDEMARSVRAAFGLSLLVAEHRAEGAT